MASDPIKCFRLFFTHEILKKMVIETNRYFEQLVANHNVEISESHSSDYYLFKHLELNQSDLLQYFGAIIYMSLNTKKNMRDHWKEDEFYESKFLKKYLSYCKYKIIKRFFHLTDNDSHKFDHRFYKIIPFMEELATQFRNYYAPSQNLTVDESMISFKGRSKAKFYIPSKPTKWGFKLHCLVQGIALIMF